MKRYDIYIPSVKGEKREITDPDEKRRYLLAQNDKALLRIAYRKYKELGGLRWS